MPLPTAFSVRTDRTVKIKYVDYGGPAIDLFDAQWEHYNDRLQLVRGDGFLLRLDLVSDSTIRFEGYIHRSLPIIGRADHAWPPGDVQATFGQVDDESDNGTKNNRVKLQFSGMEYWAKNRDRMKLKGPFPGTLEIDYPE